VTISKELKYLKKNGFTENQINSIHHWSINGRWISYENLISYFEVPKNYHARNEKFVERVQFIASEHRKSKRSFQKAINDALDRWPLVW